jgi:hypothetical protein
VETIHGIIKSGDEIDVPMEDILHVEVKRVDEARTAALVLGVILTLVAAAIIIAVSTVNPDPDL